MQPSLSLILPAFNAERTLASQVHRLLEVVGELTTRFEIIVIDDGSTDHTCDVADELAREYPQLRVVRHGTRRGMDGVVETSLARTKGEVLMLLTPGTTVQIAEMKRLWQASQGKASEPLQPVASPRPLSRALLGRLSQWGASVTSESPANNTVQLLHRDNATPSLTNEPRRPANFTAHLRDLAIGE